MVEKVCIRQNGHYFYHVNATRIGIPASKQRDRFTLQEDHGNTFEPAKKSFHTIIPAFITKDSKPYVSFGLTGGGMQLQGHAAGY